MFRGQLGQKIVGDRAADQGGIKRLQMIDHFRKGIDHLFESVLVSVMPGAKMLRHLEGCSHIGAVFNPNHEGIQVMFYFPGQGGHHAAVQPAAQADTHGHFWVGDHALLNGSLQLFTDGADPVFHRAGGQASCCSIKFSRSRL